jgi:hypothetical protein
MTPVLVLAAATLAQPPAPPAPRFVAHAANALFETGRLVRLTPKLETTLADPAAMIPAGELVGLTRAEKSRPPLPAGPQLLLATGDRIPGTVTGGDDLAVRISPVVTTAKPASTWRVPLAQVRVLWVDDPPADTPTDPDRYPWLDPARKKDVVLLRNGDVLTGDIERFADDGESLSWKPAGGKGGTSVDLALVSAVAFNPTLVAARKPKGAYARLVTASGARVSATAIESDGTRFRGTTTFGAKLDLALADVIALDVIQGKSVYLSDLKPKRATTEPYGDLSWPWAADRSVKGNPLRLVTPLGEETFDKGLGTHPKTTLTYDLGGKYRRFEATVGLDAATGRRGAAKVNVLVDGKVRDVPGLERLSATGGSVAVSVDVTKAKELTLVIDFGPSGDVQADVNWANARLVE